MKKTLHIVSFDIPFPPNYGGVIDVFYKLKALWEKGVEITLHCFEYGGREKQTELEKYCKKVHYYPRRKIVYEFWLPYIVSSRKNSELLQNLLLDEAPILFEALHSCYYLNHPALNGRQKLVRMHNIEHDYYNLLAAAENNIFRKSYYLYESIVLREFENKLGAADLIFGISEKDCRQLKMQFADKVHFLPAFHGNSEFTAKTGKGNYCFYHGKLSVSENHQAAMYLVNEVFNKITVPLLIAGDGVSDDLRKAVLKNKHIEILEGLSTAEIFEKMENAHVNVLPTFQPTGIKLKLVNVLFKGRFCMVNSPMVTETGLEAACLLADDASEMAMAIEKLMNSDFTEEEINKRKMIIGGQFDVNQNAGKIIGLLD